MAQYTNPEKKIERICKKIVDFWGLSENVAPILGQLIIAKQSDEKPLSAEYICEKVPYSRSSINSTLNLLESLELISHITDTSQTGRGRKKKLYSLRVSFDNLLELGLEITYERIKSIKKTSKKVCQDLGKIDPELAKIAEKIREAAENLIDEEKAEITSSPLKSK